MPSAKKALLISAMLAAAAIAGLALYVSSVRTRPIGPEPSGDSGGNASGESGRLIAPSESGTALYTDSENGFLLYHPQTLTPITKRDEMAGRGYIPVCDPDHALVCFPYDPKEYEGTNFESAALSVDLRDDLATEAKCLAPQQAEKADGAVMIGDTVFASFSYGDAAASHRLDGRYYRAFRKDKCYELATRVATTVFEVWEPGSIKEFKPADEASVRAVLDKMLMSFRFEDGLELK